MSGSFRARTLSASPGSAFAFCTDSFYIRNSLVTQFRNHAASADKEPMPKSLVIVESPAKAKTIGRYLGDAYTVKASMGHIKDLPKSKLGIQVDNGFEL